MLLGITKSLSKVIVPIYTLTRKVREYLFLHNISNTCYYQIVFIFAYLKGEKWYQFVV